MVDRAAVALDIRLELGLPEAWSGGGHLGVSASLVEVPEAAVDKNGDLAAGHDDVRSARKVAPMQPESVARGEKQSADKKLGLRVLPSDAGHHSAAVGG